MLGCLSRAGYAISPEPEEADIIILNTCGFIRPARDEAAKGIEDALALKRKRPDRIIAVAGCFVERYRPDLERRYPGVDVWLGVRDFDHIVEALERRPYERGLKTYLYGRESPRLLSTPSTWAYLKISEGCSHECAFCAIPLIKGAYRSRSIPSIVAEAGELAGRGVREVNLISQDTTYFGRDKGLMSELIGLLRRLIDVRGISWIRLLYGYPEEITPALLEVMKEGKICSYLDIPFQHADRRLLKSMKRSMSGTRALRLIEKIRKALPDVAIRTSLIVGFPGEGRDEFLRLKKFVREAQFDHLGVFTYSPEEGTGAFELGDPVPESEKASRRDDIMSLQAEIAASIQRKYLRRRLEVLIDSSSSAGSEGIVGRARFQAPEVDGVVLIDPSGPAAGPIRPIEKVEIISAEVYDLRGIVVR
ncbi:MAG: ribosomal protein S12 methylthiotransferase RimO [Candidatus Aminicenantes bacterium RBG_19FT_COMBO_58_17]|nr:MAG: ribosomal protein S12 methylthiotransferase RimO [Candidatus Aminicenantes bacterium RBG_19FT_COMBO_58_17]